MENLTSLVGKEKAKVDSYLEKVAKGKSLTLKGLKLAYGEDWEQSWLHSWFVHYCGTAAVEQKLKQDYINDLRTMARWWGVHGRVIGVALVTAIASCFGFFDLKHVAAVVASVGGLVVHEYVLFISRRFEDYAACIEKKHTPPAAESAANSRAPDTEASDSESPSTNAPAPNNTTSTNLNTA